MVEIQLILDVYLYKLSMACRDFFLPPMLTRAREEILFQESRSSSNNNKLCNKAMITTRQKLLSYPPTRLSIISPKIIVTIRLLVKCDNKLSKSSLIINLVHCQPNIRQIKKQLLQPRVKKKKLN